MYAYSTETLMVLKFTSSTIDSLHNVTLEAGGSRWLTMAWELPTLGRSHGSFIAYSTECQSEGVFTLTNYIMVQNVTQTEINNVAPFTTYNCCVSLQTTQANSVAICQQQRTPEEGTQIHAHIILAWCLVLYKIWAQK